MSLNPPPCTVTESLVRTSCGGTSKVMVLRSTTFISSMQGMMKNNPGPAAPPFFSLKCPELVSIRELVSDVNLPSLKRMARSYSGTMRIQKKMEMGNVRMMRMMEMIVSRTEQQSEEVSGCSSLSPIATICGANENQNKLTPAQLSPRAWNSYFSFRFSW